MRLVVDWVAPDPAALGARLADRLRLPRPDPDDERLALVLVDGIVRIAATGPGGRERLAGVAVAPDTSGGPSGRVRRTGVDDERHGARLLGVAWATVELERGAREVAARFGLDATAFRQTVDDAWLGAAARVTPAVGARLVLLEPTTEGRVAAALARFGEGPIGIYAGLPGPAAGTVRAGPLGAGSLVPGSPAWGPFAIVIAEPAIARVRSTAAGTIGR